MRSVRVLELRHGLELFLVGIHDRMVRHPVAGFVGAGVGIGQIGKGAVESIARQPEATNDIRATMILAAALVEGVALLAAVAGLLAVFR